MDDNRNSTGGEQQSRDPNVLRPRGSDPAWNLKYYRDVARRSKGLTHGEFRTLDALLAFADWSTAGGKSLRTDGAGANCYPKREAVAEAIGKEPATVDDFLRGLERKGWISRIPFVRVPSGRRTTDLIQFRVPKEEPNESAAGMQGPIEWSKRKQATPARKTSPLWRGKTWPGDDR